MRKGRSGLWFEVLGWVAWGTCRWRGMVNANSVCWAQVVGRRRDSVVRQVRWRESNDPVRVHYSLRSETRRERAVHDQSSGHDLLNAGPFSAVTDWAF